METHPLHIKSIIKLSRVTTKYMHLVQLCFIMTVLLLVLEQDSLKDQEWN